MIEYKLTIENVNGEWKITAYQDKQGKIILTSPVGGEAIMIAAAARDLARELASSKLELTLKFD
jgi:hypothetical protein